MARQAWRIGIPAAAVALFAAGVVAMADVRMVEDRKLAPGGKLVVEADAGSVELKGGSGSGAHIVITSEYDDMKEQFDFQFEESAGSLRIVVKKKGSEGWMHGWFGGSVHAPRLDIEIPTQTELEIKTGGGHIEVDSIRGKSTLRTSGGHIQVRDLDGLLSAQTSGGHISLKKLNSDASVETSGGHIEAESLKGKLHAETSGGHISLKDVSGDIDASTSGGHISITGAGGRVHADTSGGHIEVSFARGNGRGGEIESSGGGITVALDSSLGFNVDAETGGGSVNSDVPVTTEGKHSKSSLRGQIGRGGEPLHIRTSAGSINIEKL